MTLSDRARSKEQKQDRREKIIAAALKLFAGSAFQAISMADLARQAGMAKGTVFLYFKTKEELFFKITQREFEQWLDHMDEVFSLKKNLDRNELLQTMAGILREHHRLAKLIAIQHAILEHNIGYDEVLAFKQMIKERMNKTGRLLEKSTAFLAPGQGFRLLMWMYAMVIGLYQMSDPSPVLKHIYKKEPGLQRFQMDFSREYFEMLGVIFEGWEARAERGKSKTNRRQP